MGNYRLELCIPGLPSSGNAKLDDHFLKQWEENKKWHQVVYLHTIKHGLPEKPLNRCRLILTRHGSVFLDYDNLTISFKSIVDGLVEAGVLADDSWQVTGQWSISQVKSTRKDAHVTVVVEELPYDGPEIKRRRVAAKKKSRKIPYFKSRRMR